MIYLFLVFLIFLLFLFFFFAFLPSFNSCSIDFEVDVAAVLTESEVDILNRGARSRFHFGNGVVDRQLVVNATCHAHVLYGHFAAEEPWGSDGLEWGNPNFPAAGHETVIEVIQAAKWKIFEAWVARHGWPGSCGTH